MSHSSRKNQPPWWLEVAGALGLGAYLASPEFPRTLRFRSVLRALFFVNSAAGAALTLPEILPPHPDHTVPVPLSRQAGSALSLTAVALANPVVGNLVLHRSADLLSRRGIRRPHSYFAVLASSAALLGSFMQRFPAPPVLKTPPPKRQLVRPHSNTIMRN